MISKNKSDLFEDLYGVLSEISFAFPSSITADKSGYCLGLIFHTSTVNLTHPLSILLTVGVLFTSSQYFL